MPWNLYTFKKFGHIVVSENAFLLLGDDTPVLQLMN